MAKINQAAVQLLADRLYNDACHCWLVCAALAKNSGQLPAVSEFVESAENTAEEKGLRPATYWADWAQAAFSFQQDDLEGVILRLKKLQQHLNEGDEWLLANTIEITWRAILEPEKDPLSRKVVADWLRLWGMPPILIAAPYWKEKKPKNRLQIFRGFVFKIWKKLRLWFSTALNPQSQVKFRPERVLEPLKPFHIEDHADYWVPIPPVEVLGPPRASPLQSALSKTPDEKPPQLASSNPPPQPEGLQPAILDLAGGQSPGETPLIVYTFGPFQAYWNGTLIANWASRKALSVFKYLLNEHDHPVAKETLMEVFWSDADVESARRNLHQAIYSLRQTLRAHDPGAAFIQFKNDSYFIQQEMEIWMDFRKFDRYVKEGRSFAGRDAEEKAAIAFENALVLYQDDFMVDDPYDEWLQVPRRYYRQTYLLTADWLAHYYLRRREYLLASNICHRMLSFETTHESAHMTLMQCYLQMGQRHLALLQYRNCKEALARELNITPSQELKTLYRRILQS